MRYQTSILAVVFWLLQFLYQYFSFSNGDIGASLVRSFAFTAATLIGIALLVSPLALFTKLNYIRHRRTLGDWGVTFVIMHFIAVLFFYFAWDVSQIFQNLDPFTNLWLMGFISMLVFLPVYVSSSRLVAMKLGRRWKNVQRLSYPAYILAIVHYIGINPAAMATIPGYLLILVTGLVLLLQFLGFLKRIKQTKDKKSIIWGIAIILFAIVLLFYSGLSF